MKNYIIEDVRTGRTVASGLACGKRDARRLTGCGSRRYRVIEATGTGINYQPIRRL